MTTQASDIQTFTLGALQAAGVRINAVEDGLAYRAVISDPGLKRILQRAALHFTFNEEYFDIHRESDVEYVAPGYPLLDALIRMTQARFVVSEAVIAHQNAAPQIIQGGVLPLTLRRSGRYRPLLRFRIRVTYKSDSYEEEITSVTVDPHTGQTLSANGTNWPLLPVSDKVAGMISPLAEAAVLQAWGIVENEIQTIVADKIARQEDLANQRLHHELSKLQQYLQAQQTLATPQGQHRVQELKNRYGLTVKLDLIFAEVLHYPVELVTGTVTRQHPRTQQPWSEVIRFEIDRFTGRIDKPPACPVCRSPLTTLAPCDDGGHVVCPVCSTQCSTCGAAHCADHGLSKCQVSGCGCGHCGTCLSHCERCTHAMCPETCTVNCPDCQRTVCRDCTLRCGDCLLEGCEDHFQRCHITNVPLCSRHAALCDRCASPTQAAHLHALIRPGGQEVTLCDSCGEHCAVSGERFHPDDLVQCHHTKRRLDPALAVICPGCHHPVGRDVFVQTTGGTAACPSCVDLCSACSAVHLRAELEACAGDHPGQATLLCEAHRHHCTGCPPGLVYCQAHVGHCAVGGESVCRAHAVTSQLSQRLLCHSHGYNCPDCRRTVATDELVTVPDRDGTVRQVCRACTDVCLDCPPERNRYARTTLTRCQCQSRRDQHFGCPAHSTTCHVTRKPYAVSHALRCQACNQITGWDQTKTTKQGKVICMDCVGVCPHCPPGTVHALTGLHLCRTCNKVACAEHTHICIDCGVSVCEHHAVLLPGGAYVCTGHARTCGNCGTITTASNTAACHSPQAQAEILCAECQTTCPSCQKPHCTRHSHRCLSCGETYCQFCAGNLCTICVRMKAVGPDLERMRTHVGTLKALGLDLPEASSPAFKVAAKGSRVHMIYTPPPKGFAASLKRLFSKPPQRLVVLEEEENGQFRVIADREVPTF